MKKEKELIKMAGHAFLTRMALEMSYDHVWRSGAGLYLRCNTVSDDQVSLLC
jgi:hypothetical protein